MATQGMELGSVLNAAQWEAARQGREAVGSGHLLLGLFHPPLTGAARVLASLGVEPKQDRLASGMPVASDDVWPPSIPVPALASRLTREGEQVLQLATKEAETRGDDIIAPEHLVLGLLRQRHGLGAVLLTVHGLTADKLRPLLFPAVRPT